MTDFDRAYRENAEIVYRYVFSLTRNADLAEEVTQQTFYEALRHPGNYRGDAALSTYLCGIAGNLMKKELARRAKENHVPIEDMADLPGDGSAEDAAMGSLNRQDLFAKNKSLDMGFGVIGFRASTKIVQLRGVTAEMTLERLHQYHLTDGIRVKEEINKDAAMGWPDERLELVGLKRQQSDTFFIEISKEDVPDNG